MKIGLVLPSTPKYSETFLINKIKGLESHGFEVLLFVNSDSKKSEYKTVVNAPKLNGNKIFVLLNSILILIKALLFSFSTTKKLFLLNKNESYSFTKNVRNIIINQHILAHKIDWLHFEFGTMAIGRENVAEAVKAKMGVSFRGFDIGIYPIKNKDCYNLLWKKADKIHVISDDIKYLVVKNGFKDFSKIVKICPAIDTSFFSTDSTQNAPSEVTQLVTIARLNWKKGLEYTIEAMRILSDKGIKFHYNIIGDGQEYERLKFAVNQLNLTNHITFLGKLQPSEVKEYLSLSDIYIQYSIQEGFCNAVLEAQAMKKICIVSDAEGLSENVLDTKTGFVVPKRNPLSLAQKIEDVIYLNSETKMTIQNNAFIHANENFNLNQQIDQIIKFYD